MYPIQFFAENPILALPGPSSEQKLQTVSKNCLSRNFKKLKRNVKFNTSQELGESLFYRGYAFAKVNNLEKASKDFDNAIKESLYCIDYEFFQKLDGKAKDILETQLKLLNLFSFK